ncbi:MAG: endonuclease 4 [Lentisphaerae bacterium ADurb.Bin242]|nr:MAG: endonuclease 4 [Lentisphaerae bacterium ADurb.Bin242]
MKIPVTHLCYPLASLPDSVHAPILREYAANGAKHIVLASSLIGRMLQEPDFIFKMKKTLAETGLDFCDAHAPWGTWSDLGIPLGEYRKLAVAQQRAAIRLCGIFGVTTMAFHTGTTFNSVFGKNRTLEDYYQALLRSLEELLPTADECGVIIALENQGTPLNHSGRLLRIVQEFNSPRLGLCYDTGHGNVAEKGRGCPEKTYLPGIWNDAGLEVEWEENLIEKFLPWLVNCHLHDNDGMNDQHKLPGDGVVDWKRIVSNLEKAPRLHNIQNEAITTYPNGYTIKGACRLFNELVGHIEQAGKDKK